jgi:Cohesin domain
MAAMARAGAGMLASKVARITLLFGVILSWSAVYASATAILSIEPPSQVVQSGRSFSLGVLISNVADLYAFQFDLTFDPLILSATGVTEGPFLPSGGTTAFIAGSIENIRGTISSTADSLIGLLPGVSGTGALAIVDFDALALGTSSITLSSVVMLDSNFGVIATNIVNGTVSVIPEPSALLLLASAVAGLLSIGLRPGSARKAGQAFPGQEGAIAAHGRAGARGRRHLLRNRRGQDRSLHPSPAPLHRGAPY